ncbi:MAG: NHLP-related RiPP peptide [Anaerolineae bacterium]
MSRATFERLVRRMAADDGFRQLVAADPAAALAAFGLTPEEREAFMRLDASVLDGPDSSIDERIGKHLDRFLVL